MEGCPGANHLMSEGKAERWRRRDDRSDDRLGPGSRHGGRGGRPVGGRLRGAGPTHLLRGPLRRRWPTGSACASSRVAPSMRPRPGRRRCRRESVARCGHRSRTGLAPGPHPDPPRRLRRRAPGAPRRPGGVPRGGPGVRGGGGPPPTRFRALRTGGRRGRCRRRGIEAWPTLHGFIDRIQRWVRADLGDEEVGAIASRVAEADPFTALEEALDHLKD